MVLLSLESSCILSWKVNRAKSWPCSGQPHHVPDSLSKRFLNSDRLGPSRDEGTEAQKVLANDQGHSKGFWKMLSNPILILELKAIFLYFSQK